MYIVSMFHHSERKTPQTKLISTSMLLNHFGIKKKRNRNIGKLKITNMF